MATAFAQGGTVNWASLAANQAATAITLMHRFSLAGIGEHTIEVVKAVGSTFSILYRALEKISHASYTVLFSTTKPKCHGHKGFVS
ncbi:Protein of unknown function [Pyronema omphalodes CBS 100304]|uniref:Uncharacterized protein n=1 Tax=Pyronema omphalodes (strain CBS 100304) TaxID=1076935 RepID=U4LGR0_PYROM|nr:Protein of unknown function [Pyronema omphalodes CBS 100304]